MEEEPEIPTWCARMPGDPEIDRDVKSGEEKLWEAVYDNKVEKMELLFKMLDECVLACQRRAPRSKLPSGACTLSRMLSTRSHDPCAWGIRCGAARTAPVWTSTGAARRERVSSCRRTRGTTVGRHTTWPARTAI